MQKPFFSVVIPALNEQKYLPLLLEDLSKQSFNDFDVWVVDGKSEDKTQDIVREWAKKQKNIHLVVAEKRGVSRQRNLGAKKSSGQYLAFLDADARIPAHFIEGLHYYIVRDNIVSWSNATVPESVHPKDRLYSYVFNLALDVTSTVDQGWAVGASMGCKRNFFELLHGFDEEIQFMEDIDFAQRLRKNNVPISVLKDPTFTFNFRRVRADGYMNIVIGLIPTIMKVIKNEKITDMVKAYPMLGGSYFDKKKKEPIAKKRIRSITTAFSQGIKKREKEIRKLLQDAFGEF